MDAAIGAITFDTFHPEARPIQYRRSPEQSTEVAQLALQASFKVKVVRLRKLPMPSSHVKPAMKPIDRRRRRHPRYRADFLVTVSCFSGDAYQKLDGHCRDLSAAGIAILLATELTVGEVAGLSFSLPGSALAWEVRAVVRYRRGYHYGFEFLSLTSEQQTSLNSYFNGLEPMD